MPIFQFWEAAKQKVLLKPRQIGRLTDDVVLGLSLLAKARVALRRLYGQS